MHTDALRIYSWSNSNLWLIISNILLAPKKYIQTLGLKV